MKKIVVVMTYFDRQFQLNRTLDSIAKSKHDNFEVIIIDDNSPEEIKLNKYHFPISIFKTINKQWTNPEPAYNTGFIEALRNNPEIIINQNAEAYHFGDVLMYAENNLTDSNYITYGCFSLDKDVTFKNEKIDEQFIKDIIASNNVGASRDCQTSWYNHPIYRPVALEFCAALTAKNLKLINGYDERLAFGIGYGDDFLRERIKMAGIKVEITTDPIVLHQWHKRSQEPHNKAELMSKNKALLEEYLKENNYKAKHIFTKDL